MTTTPSASPIEVRSTMRAIRPPTQTVAASRWVASALTAVSWSADPPAWPASPSTTTANRAATRRKTATDLARASAATDAMRAAVIALINPTRSGSTAQTVLENCTPKLGSLTGTPARSANHRTTPTAPAIAQTKAATMANDIAAARRGSSTCAEAALVAPGIIVAASSSAPTVREAATSCTTRTSGSAQRTTGPAVLNPASSGCAAPLKRAATRLASRPMTTTPATTSRYRASGRRSRAEEVMDQE